VDVLEPSLLRGAGLPSLGVKPVGLSLKSAAHGRQTYGYLPITALRPERPGVVNPTP